eukprot:4124125-Prymnesium_polylepis.1
MFALLIERAPEDRVAHDGPLLDHAESLLDRAPQVALLLVHLREDLAHRRRRLAHLGRVRGQNPRLRRLDVQR